MAWINVLGGVAVLGSYAHGIATQVDPGRVWGGVPIELQPVYTVSMFAAAFGYLLFTYFVFFRVDPATARIGSTPAYPLLNLLYVAALVPSALWMPLTFAMLDAPSGGLWFAIRLVLAIVGLAALGIIYVLARLEPDPGRGWRIAAVLGAVAFANQTALLDAIVWPAYFPV